MFKRQILTDCMDPIHKITGKRWTGLLGTTRKARIISAGAIFLAVCAFGAAGVAPMAPDASDLPVKSIAQDLELPNLADQIAALQKDDQKFVHEEKIRAGDTLAVLLQRLGVDDPAAVAFIKSDKVAKGVMQLTTGKKVQAQTGENGDLQWLKATLVDKRDNPAKQIMITRSGDKFVAKEAPAELERRVEMRAREITTSLYGATDATTDGGKLPDAIVAQIIEMFSTSIDFRSDLKRGDRFNVVYETFWQDGEMVRAGRILAGEFTNRGTTYQSVWYEDPITRQGGYYSFDGKALKKGLPQVAAGIFAYLIGLFQPRAPDHGRMESPQGHRFRGSHGHADPRIRRRRGRFRRCAGRLRQLRGAQALGQLHHGLRPHEPFRSRPAPRPASQAGRCHWLCRLDRLVDRRPPAL
jgi:hypothetical protein